MPKELYLLVGAVFTAVITLIVARFSGSVQLSIARDNSKKDMLLQQQRLLDERRRAEAALERAKLEELHNLLSTLAFENSQTMSYIQNSRRDLSHFRERYIENCARLHKALAIADLYYPAMSASIRKIDESSSVFWGHQEAVIQIDIQENSQGWHSNLGNAIDAGNEIGRLVRDLHAQVRVRGEAIGKAMATGEPR